MLFGYTIGNLHDFLEEKYYQIRVERIDEEKRCLDFPKEIKTCGLSSCLKYFKRWRKGMVPQENLLVQSYNPKEHAGIVHMGFQSFENPTKSHLPKEPGIVAPWDSFFFLQLTNKAYDYFLLLWSPYYRKHTSQNLKRCGFYKHFLSTFIRKILLNQPNIFLIFNTFISTIE